ncbi:MAG TPA: Mur ligase family protein, partial [Acidimicrobiia bacterium]|nr:Mur ligase family protein [Acidimicrobiia bacterium]
MAAASLLAAIPAGLRWLRVAQREHYLAGEVTRSAGRWRRSGIVNFVVELSGFGAIIAMILHDAAWGFVVVAITAVWPIGLSVRGVTSPLAWTDRLRRLAAVSGLLLVTGLVFGGLADEPLVVVLPLFLLYAVVDVSLWLMGPFERRHGEKWVEKAAGKIRSLDLDIVAITGSYGKTTTKNYLAHLLAGSRRVVASPASFNNRMGLARAINEGLTPGTEVFVAEMGTYGPGEIAELTGWIPPKVAAMVAIGPVHLERFGTVEAIVRAKEEILERAEVGVICVDDPLLAAVAHRRRQEMSIVEVSTDGGIAVAGEKLIDAPPGVFAANLAVALGVCHALGIDLDEVVGRVADLPVAEHRQSVSVGPGGFTIVDDTFNSNPA